MNFQKHSIQSNPLDNQKKKPEEKKSSDSAIKRLLKKIPHIKVKELPRWQKALLGGLVGVGVFFILSFFWSIYIFFSHFSLSEVLLLFGSMETDKNNHTQILLLGSGDKGHDSPDLTDTIIIASLNHDQNTVSMLSVPRDLWLNIPGYTSSRVNKVYENHLQEYGKEGAMKILIDSLETALNQDIQYYAKIDFNVFKDAVDAVGGIDITLEDKLCDDQYPDENLIGYTALNIIKGDELENTNCINPGTYLIDGDMALHLARSRHGIHYDENGKIIKYSSDFDRAERQQKIIKALKDKVLNGGILKSPTKVKNLFDTYINNVETNLGLVGSFH